MGFPCRYRGKGAVTHAIAWEEDQIGQPELWTTACGETVSAWTKDVRRCRSKLSCMACIAALVGQEA